MGQKSFTIVGISFVVLVVLFMRIRDIRSSKIIDGTIDSIGKRSTSNINLPFFPQLDGFPVIKLVFNGSVVTYDEKTYMYHWFEEGEKIRVIIKDNDLDTLQIFSVYGFWFTIPTIIIMTFAIMMVFGIREIIYDKKKG